MIFPPPPGDRPIHPMKIRALPVILCFGATSLLQAQDLPRKGESPRPALPSIARGEETALPPGSVEQTGPEAPRQVRSYALGSPAQGWNSDEGRRLQKSALDLISLALESNQTPATHRDRLTLHGDTGVIIARATEGQHLVIADVIRALKEGTPDRPAPAPAPALAKTVVRIYALGKIFGIPDSGSEPHQEERATKTDALISQIRTGMAMAGLDRSMPELTFHGPSNSLIAKGTAAQIDLVSQAIAAWRENAPDHRPFRGQ